MNMVQFSVFTLRLIPAPTFEEAMAIKVVPVAKLAKVPVGWNYPSVQMPMPMPSTSTMMPPYPPVPMCPIPAYCTAPIPSAPSNN